MLEINKLLANPRDFCHSLTMKAARVFAVLLGIAAAQAQDPLKVAPKNYSLKFENEDVRVFEFSGKPGDRIGTHRLSKRVIHVLSGGTLEVFDPQGKPKELVLQTGESVWMNPALQSARVVGENEIRTVVVEMKPKFPKPRKKTSGSKRGRR